MGNDELNEERKRWGDHVEAVHTFPTVPKDVKCPIRFGDIVHTHGGGVGVVRLPDQGGGLFSMLELDGSPRHYSFPDTPKSIITTWGRVLRVIGSHGDLPDRIKELLEPFKMGIVLGAMHWDRSVHFLDEQEYELFREGRWSELSIGSKQLVDEFFTEYSRAEAHDDAGSYRVLVHTDQDWNSWRCFGPGTAAEAEDLIGGLSERYKMPEEIRRGVYVVDPETMTKYELFRGYTKIGQQHLCRGQGETPTAKSSSRP